MGGTARRRRSSPAPIRRRDRPASKRTAVSRLTRAIAIGDQVNAKKNRPGRWPGPVISSLQLPLRSRALAPEAAEAVAEAVPGRCPSPGSPSRPGTSASPAAAEAAAGAAEAEAAEAANRNYT